MSLGHCAPCATSSAVFPNPWHLPGASQSLTHGAALQTISLMLLSQVLGWLRWGRKTREGLSVRSGKHARNAAGDILQGRHTPSLLICHDSCGCRKGLVTSTPRVGTLTGCRVPGCSNRHWEAHCFVFGSGCNVHAVGGWEMCFLALLKFFGIVFDTKSFLSHPERHQRAGRKREGG